MNNVIHKIVKKIGETNPQFSEIELKKMEYGIVCMVSDLSKAIIYFIIFFMFNLQQYFIISFIFYSFIRIFCGGYHAKTYVGCLFISFITFLITIILSLNFNINMYIILILLVSSIIITAIVAPVDNVNKKIKTKQRRKNLKYLSVIITFLFSVACFLIPKPFFNVAALSIVMAMVMAVVGKISYYKYARTLQG